MPRRPSAIAPAVDPYDIEAIEARLTKASAFLSAGNADAAIREAAAVLEADPDGVLWGFRALDITGDAYWAKDEYEDALAIGHRLLQIAPERNHGYIHVARSALRLKDYPHAARAIDDGLERFPADAHLMALRSIGYRECGQHALAIEWARKATAQAPDSPHVLDMLALALITGGRDAEAKVVLTQAIGLDPTVGHTLAIHAVEAYKANRFAEAVRHAEQALALDPADRLAQQIRTQARVFAHPLMRPYWAVQSWGEHQIIGYGVLALIGIAFLSLLRVAPLAIVGVALYVMCCVVTIAVVESRGKKAAASKQSSLDGY